MKAKIYIEPAFGTLNMIFYEERNGKNYVVEPIEFKLTEHKEGAPVNPTIKLPYHVSNEFLQSMAEEIEARGIRPSKVLPYESELSAIKYHLEDMRTLVFKKVRK